VSAVQSLTPGAFGHIKQPPGERPRPWVFCEPLRHDFIFQIPPGLMTMALREFIKKIEPSFQNLAL
jgi:hypothetical protein